MMEQLESNREDNRILGLMFHKGTGVDVAGLSNK
jgi:hypothetical protein